MNETNGPFSGTRVMPMRCAARKVRAKRSAQWQKAYVNVHASSKTGMSFSVQAACKAQSA